MSKKFKFLILLIIVLIIVGLVFGISTIYRFYVLQKIYNSINENISKDNYYLKTTVTNNGETKITETYYKDGIGKLVAENGIYTWVNGEDAYMVDEANKKIYILDIESSIGLVSNEMFASLYPGYSKSLFERFIFAGNMRNKIKTVKLNDEKCIMIQTKENTNTKTVWISKKRNDLIKAKIEFPNGDVYEYDYELSFNVTKLKNTELPDISDYTIITENNEEIILDDNINTENQLENIVNEDEKTLENENQVQ